MLHICGGCGEVTSNFGLCEICFIESLHKPVGKPPTVEDEKSEPENDSDLLKEAADLVSLHYERAVAIYDFAEMTVGTMLNAQPDESGLRRVTSAWLNAICVRLMEMNPRLYDEKPSDAGICDNSSSIQSMPMHKKAGLLSDKLSALVPLCKDAIGMMNKMGAICADDGGNCCGDSSVGISPCPLWKPGDVVNGNHSPSGCEAKSLINKISVILANLEGSMRDAEHS